MLKEPENQKIGAPPISNALENNEFGDEDRDFRLDLIKKCFCAMFVLKEKVIFSSLGITSMI